MGLLIPIGLGLLLFAMAGKKSKPAARLPAPTPPVTEALARAEQGVATSEDYSALADEAEQNGDSDVAERMREQADAPPTPPGVPGPTLPTGPQAKPDDALDTPSDDPAEAEAEEAEVQAAPPPPTVDPAEAAEPPPAAPTPQSDPTNPDPSFTPPTGFDPSKAGSMAQGLNDHISATRYSYNRGRVREFQKAAGIAADGIYGPGTHAALAFYGVNNPTRGLFRGSTTTYPETLAYWAQRMGFTP